MNSGMSVRRIRAMINAVRARDVERMAARCADLAGYLAYGVGVPDDCRLCAEDMGKGRLWRYEVCRAAAAEGG